MVDTKKKAKKGRKAARMGIINPNVKKPTKSDSGVTVSAVAKQAKAKTGDHASPKINPLKRKSEDGGADPDVETKKPKLVKKEKKEERKIKKNDKETYELKQRLKLLFEKFRRDDCQKEQKIELCKEVTSLMKGHMKEIIFAHDTVRIVESLLKLSDKSLWDCLYNEVKDDLITLMKMEYARFFVLKLLKYGSKDHRKNVISAIHGHVVDLIIHAKAGSVIETVFNEFANGQERQKMITEFYGALFTICKDTEIIPLKDIIQKDPNQKDGILSQLKQTITKLVEKPAFCYSLVHRITLEYLTHCSSKDRTEMIETIRESVVKILHTKDGAAIGMMCIWHGTAKDRKVIIQSFKTHLSKICQEEHGSRVLYAIFDSVDDTKLVGKAVIEEMLKNSSEWVFTPAGRKLLLYFLAPRNSKYFHPDVMAVLRQGDDNATSKKDKAVRYQELIKVASESLLRFASDNAAALMKDPSYCFVIQEILANCLGDKAELFQDLAKLAFEPVDMPDKENPHFIEQISVRAIFKSLFELDKSNFKAGNDESLFCDALLRCVPEDSIQSWIHCNRGCFVLLIMLETEISHVVDKLKDILKPVKKIIANKKFVGANLLLERLEKIG